MVWKKENELQAGQQTMAVSESERERRKENRRSHLGRMANKRQFQIFMMVAMLSTANGMETQQILQQMSQLASARASGNRSNTSFCRSLRFNSTRS